MDYENQPNRVFSATAVVIGGALALALSACAQGEPIDGSGEAADESDTADTAGTETDESTESTSESESDSGTTETDESTSDGSCTAEGCECDGGEDSCDPGLACINGICSEASCNNDGALDPGEQCDDGNEFEGDGCDNDCTFTEVLDIVAGGAHTCALIETGRVRCWGLNSAGQLGYNNTDNIGDNEHPAEPGDVPLGEKAMAIDMGRDHVCAHLVDDNVRCWGEGSAGQLGQGNTNDIGDDEFPFSVTGVSVDEPVVDIVTGANHTCALVDGGTVRCWGLATSGQLGYGNTTNLAIPLSVEVHIGATVSAIRAGGDHNCALLADGKIRCWGRNDSGQLGYGNTDNIGDTETPGSVVPVPVMPQGIPDDTEIADIELGHGHSCVLFESGHVLCWGDNFYGQLGQGDTTMIGDNETLATLFPIDLGGDAVELTLGKHHTCALLDDSTLKCWGRNLYGQLGRGDIDHIGDDEVPADIGTIELGGTVTAVDAGDYHTCAVIDGYRVTCWGYNDFGQLGYGDTETRGDDEIPVDAGWVELL